MLWLLIGYMFLNIHRPFEVWPILGEIRIELLYMIAVSAVWLMTPNKKLDSNVIHFAVGAFALAVIFCAMASPVSDRCLEVVEPYLKFLVFYLMLVTAVQDEKSLKILLLGFVAVVGLYALHSLWEYMCGRYVLRMGIKRMVGVDLTRSDPNAFASSLVLAIIFAPVLWRAFPTRLVRSFLIAFGGLATLCILLTGSRGGFVGILMVAGLVIWKSPWRKPLAALAIPVAPLMFFLLPTELQNRFETIVNPDAGPKNAKVSTEARIEGLLIGLELWQSNPVAGIGPGAWRPVTGRKLESHNMYGQLTGEMGTVGVVTFGSILLAFAVNVWRIRRACRDNPDREKDFLYHFAGALGFGLFMLLFEGNFGHNLFRYNWILYSAFLSIAYTCVERRRESADAATDPVEWEESELGQEQWGYSTL